MYYERAVSYKCNHLYWGCNIPSCSAFDTFVRSNDRYVLVSNYYFLNNFRVSISIASSSELLSLLVVADLDGGSTYGQEKDLASCVSDDP